MHNPFLGYGPAAPVGCVLAYAGPAAVTDTGAGVNLDEITVHLAAAGWLLCDGRALPCRDFRVLHAVIGTAFGDNGPGTFCLPDLRGRFVRGVDGGAAHDVDARQRTLSGSGGASGDHVGSLQLDAFQGHEHDYTSTTDSPNTAQPGGPPMLMQLPKQPTAGEVVDGGYGSPRVAAETRPVNVALNYLIRCF